MIGRIRGRLVEVREATALIEPEVGGEPHGVALECLLPAYLVEPFAALAGREVELRTFQWYESVGQGSSFLPRLVAFRSAGDRKVFELLTTVKGLGYRRALRALAIEPAEIARAVASRDTKALTRLPEIGKKLAEQIVMDLAERMAPFLSEAERAGLDDAERPAGARELGDRALEAVAALEALGEASADAERRVRRAVGQLEADADVQAIVRAALGSGEVARA